MTEEHHGGWTGFTPPPPGDAFDALCFVFLTVAVVSWLSFFFGVSP